MKRVQKWKAPRRRPFAPEGITLGATVLGPSSGQIWSQAPTTGKTKWWWVVGIDGKAHMVAESDLIVLMQCNDIPLINTNAA